MSQGPSSELSPDQLSSLLRGRKFGSQPDELPIDMNPPMPQCSQEEIQELADYCQKYGIVGVNFGNKSPRQVLQMLKARRGDRSELNETKKQILHG